MDRETLSELMTNMGYEDSIIFENPSYLDAIIGVSDSGQVCYSYTKMIESLCKEDSMEYDEAMEFIDYNTIRALDYCQPKEKRPIVIYDDLDV